MKNLNKIELLKQLYTASKAFDAECMLTACEALTLAGVSYRAQNKVLALSRLSGVLDNVDLCINSILAVEELTIYSAN